MIVVSPDVPVSSLNIGELRRLFFFRERFWKPGLPVKVVLSQSGLVPGSCLLKEVYGLDPPSVRRLILEKLYQQEIDSPPRVVSSDEVAVAIVGAGQGLIAVVPARVIVGGPAKIVPLRGAASDPPGCLRSR